MQFVHRVYVPRLTTLVDRSHPHFLRFTIVHGMPTKRERYNQNCLKKAWEFAETPRIKGLQVCPRNTVGFISWGKWPVSTRYSRYHHDRNHQSMTSASAALQRSFEQHQPSVRALPGSPKTIFPPVCQQRVTFPRVSDCVGRRCWHYIWRSVVVQLPFIGLFYVACGESTL